MYKDFVLTKVVGRTILNRFFEATIVRENRYGLWWLKKPITTENIKIRRDEWSVFWVDMLTGRPLYSYGIIAAERKYIMDRGAIGLEDIKIDQPNDEYEYLVSLRAEVAKLQEELSKKQQEERDNKCL